MIRLRPHSGASMGFLALPERPGRTGLPADEALRGCSPASDFLSGDGWVFSGSLQIRLLIRANMVC